MKVLGIDIGIVNLSLCLAECEEKVDNVLPKLTIERWEIVDLGTQKLEESMPILYEKLMDWIDLSIDLIVIERQVGRSNPKMLAMSHAVNMFFYSHHLQNITFENSSVKFSRAKKAGFEFMCDTKDPKYNTPGKKRTATKNNAIQLAEAVLVQNQLVSWHQTFSAGVKKTRENLADSLGLIVGYLLRT